MCWNKEIGGLWSGNDIWVWKKGSYVELSDWHGRSGIVAEHVLNNETNGRFAWSKKRIDHYWELVMDCQEYKVFPKGNNLRYDSMAYFLREENREDYQRMPQESKDILIPDITHKEFVHRYRVVVIGEEFGAAIRDLFKSGMAELRKEDQRKGNE